MRTVFFLSSSLWILSVLFACHSSQQQTKVVVAYVTSWSKVLPDPSSITHINYAFGHVTETFDGVRVDNEARLRQIVNLKQDAPDLKVCLSIGGWASGGFSEMASTSEGRSAFATDCRRLVNELGLDGIDIDWEYPSSSESGIASSPDDIHNFTLLMKEIRKQIGDDKLLTLASIARGEYVDFSALASTVDFVNIMAYDIARPPYHHASLFRSSRTKGVSCQEAIDNHIAKGMPACKLVLGIPFYGHAATPLPDGMNYKDIVKQLKDSTHCRDEEAQVPYITDSSGRLICTYEDSLSIVAKCHYILERNLRGAMYWEYASDDEKGTLRQAVFKEMMKKKEKNEK